MNSNSHTFKLNKFHCIFIIGFFLINIIQASFTPLVDDEAYYWAWSQQLDWGYYDHPPMVALWIKLGYSILPNELGVRLLTCIANAFVFLFWIDILKPISQKEIQLFWVASLSFVIFQLFGFITTPDACLLFFGSFYIWTLYYFIQEKSWKNALLLGFSMVLVMYSKYHAILLIIFSIIPLIPSFIKEKKFYLAIILSLILYIPHLLWQYKNDFISLQYHFMHRNDHTIWKWNDLGDFFVGFLAFGSPFLLYFIVKSFLSKKIELFEKSMLYTVIITTVFFFMMAFRTKIQPQWFLIIYLAVFPLLYNFVKELKSQKVFNSLAILTISLFLLARIIIMIPNFIITTPMQKLKDFVWETQKVNSGIAVFERYQKAAAYSFYTKEPAECLSMYNHRKSQYDLWKTEEKLAGKEITFFSLEKTSDDFIKDEDNNTVYYNTIGSYTQYPKVLVKFTDIEKLELAEGNNPINENIEITNKSENEYKIGKSSIFTLGIIVMNEKNHPIWYFENENPELIETTGNEKLEYNFKTQINLPKGQYNAYFCLKQQGLSAKLVSDTFKIMVGE